jgi:anti-anti-sigma regulatory factor
VVVDVAEVDHLDTGISQILLALDKDRREKGLALQVIHASSKLQLWFEYGGVPAHLYDTEPS